jgi:hypothetical protein
MRVIYLAVAFKLAIGVAFAQGVGDPFAHIRACSLMEREERLECLDKLSREIAPANPSEGAANNWIVSETTSPVNYAPIVTATTLSRGGSDGSSMQLGIHCRGGRTELVISGSAISSGSANYTISYSVNNGQSLQVAAGPPTYGAGVAFTGDVVRLLQSLPDEGHIAVRILARTDANLSGNFALGGLKTVREKLAAACKWPRAVARPQN